MYLNSGSETKFGGGILDFGDGEKLTVPEQNSNPIPIDRSVSISYFEYVYEYKEFGNYVIPYQEANRNGGIVNLENSSLIPFYIESNIILDEKVIFNSTPFLTVPPVDKALLCSQSGFRCSGSC